MINRVILCGKILSTPILHNTFCRFNLSITETYVDKNNNNVSKETYHPISFVGRIAESFVSQAKADDNVLIEGKLIEIANPSSSSDRDYRVLGQTFKIITK